MSFTGLSYLRLPFLMRRVRRNRRRKPQALRALQETKLRALVTHSYEHVPYYRRLFHDAGLHPTMIRSVEDLSKIPITTKEDLRQLPSRELTADNIDLHTCLQFTTSGTTGIPLTVYRTREYSQDTMARKLVTDFLCGDRFWYRRAIFTQWTPAQPRFYQRFGIFPTQNISPFKGVEWQMQQLQTFQPHIIFTLPSHAVVLANAVKEQGLQHRDLRLIISQGELLDPQTRTMVEAALDTEMFERYGSAEAPRIYAECHAHSCHIQSDRHFIEVTQQGETLGLDEEGDITATDLDNYAMPFLRYNHEDVGILLEDTCTCRCTYPLMRLTAGRTRDYIQLPNGHLVPANTAYNFLRLIAGIEQFQVIQTQWTTLHVKLVTSAAFRDTAYNAILQEFHRRLGEELTIEFTVVDTIPRGPTGKLSAFKTHLPIPQI
jgi:phenylacetate-CoA ligase